MTMFLAFAQSGRRKSDGESSPSSSGPRSVWVAQRWESRGKSAFFAELFGDLGALFSSSSGPFSNSFDVFEKGEFNFC